MLDFFLNKRGFPRNGECLKSKVSKNSYKTYKNPSLSLLVWRFVSPKLGMS